jgi:type 1 glutamine amidotransferase
MTDRQERAVIAFVRSGGGLLALHNANALRPWTQKDNPAPLLKVLGCQYDGHGGSQDKVEVRVLAKDHAITRGVVDFSVVDERHRPRLLADDAVPLLQAASGSETSVAGYIRTEGEGRIFYLSLGHNAQVLDMPQVQRLLVNGSKWCCRMSP